MKKPTVYDHNGYERDWDWLVATFGEIGLEPVVAPAEQSRAYRAVLLEAAQGPPVFVVKVVDGGGNPIAGIQVARHWPDAPELPYLPPPSSIWHERGVAARTSTNGEVSFVTGVGDVYAPPDSGASNLWVADQSGPSDLVSGIGMLAGTQNLHLNVVFQQKPVVPPEPAPKPPPPPPPEPSTDEQWQMVMSKLDLLIDLLEKNLEK